MAACIFDDRAHIKEALQLVENARIHTAPDGTTFRVSKEFKYSKCKDTHKDRFFEEIAEAKFRVRAIILDKELLWSDRLLAQPGHLKNELIFQLMSSHFGTIDDAKLVIDGQDTRAFEISDRDHFMARVNGRTPGTLREVEFADSAKNGLVQLADMVAGAIRRRVETGEAKAIEHMTSFVTRTRRANGGTYWHFT